MALCVHQGGILPSFSASDLQRFVFRRPSPVPSRMSITTGMKPPAISILVFLAILASSCAPAAATPGLSNPTVLRVSPTERSATRTATSPQAGNCYYVWASQDLPDLSQELDRQLHTVDPALSGSAYAFGEDCVAADGTRTFGAMETDFRIQVQVDDLADRERMGNAIGDVMAVIDKLPASMLQGPQPGRAEFEFKAASSDALRLIVDLASYQDVASGLHGAKLFDALQSVR